MPPVKGNLAATQAILSLFLDGPETFGNLRRRLERDFSDAHWSRSIVDSSLRSLVAQDQVVLIETGEKPGDNLYNITDRGLSEFRRALRETPRAPVPVRDPLQLWIEHSTPEELPALLRVIKESETAARRELYAAKRRLDVERSRGGFGPPDNSDWRGRVRYAIFSDKVLQWDDRLNRLASFRRVLKGDRDMHKRVATDDDPKDHHA